MNTKNSRRVMSMLGQKLDRRKITLKDITHIQGAASYLGAVEESPNEIVVYYNSSHPESVREASFVHEILHVILAHEGYPRVTIDETSSVSLPPALQKRLPNLKDRFKSAIDHPEVFRRILSQFELDTDFYFNASRPETPALRTAFQ